MSRFFSLLLTKRQFTLSIKQKGFWEKSFNIALLFGITFFMTACSAIQGRPICQNKKNLQWLLPTPKKASIGNYITLDSSKYAIVNQADVPADTLNWLRSELKKNLNWSESAKAAGTFTITLKMTTEVERNEFYTLKLTGKGIEIQAGDKAGIYRAIGRLLCIAESPLFKVAKTGSVTFPKLFLKDWPDYKLRGMHLRMNSNWKHKNANRQKHYINTIAKLGFNMVVIEIGGHFDSETHPECVVKPTWSKAQLHDIITYTRTRGLMPIPCISSIGHLHSGPVIFPLKGNNRHGKNQPIVNNIAHPDFYRIYFDMSEELLKIFGNPPYIHIGSDEFDRDNGVKMLEKATGKNGHQLFAEFLNKVYSHFAEMRVKTIMWHDMLVDPTKFSKEEMANGKSTSGALKNINRNIIIDYWCYRNLPAFRFIEEIKNNHFHEFWVSSWNDPNNVESLARKAYKSGASGLLGTTWNCTPHMETIPETAEYSWNAAVSDKKSAHIFSFYNDFFFYSRPGSKLPTPGIVQINETSGLTLPSGSFRKKFQAAFPGGKIDLYGVSLLPAMQRSFFTHGSTPPPKVKDLSNAEIIKKCGNIEDMRIMSSKSNEWIHPTGVDHARHRDDCIIYTPDFGDTTRTNQWGYELAVQNGKIIRKSRNGNMKIPQDGYVLSGHGKHNCSFIKSLRVGDDLSVRSRPRKINSKTISMKLNASHFIVFFTTEYPMDRKETLATLKVTCSGQKYRTYNIDSKYFFPVPSQKKGEWNLWTVPTLKERKNLNRIIAVEWKSPKGLKAEKLDITATPDGIESGLVVLGSLQY